MDSKPASNLPRNVVCALGVLFLVGVTKGGFDAYDQLIHINEPRILPKDHIDVAKGCAEFFPPDARKIRLIYRNRDSMVDAFEFYSKASLSGILKRVKSRWKIERKSPSGASLLWISTHYAWKGEPYAELWKIQERFVVARTSYEGYVRAPDNLWLEEKFGLRP